MRGVVNLAIFIAEADIGVVILAVRNPRDGVYESGSVVVIFKFKLTGNLVAAIIQAPIAGEFF